MELAGAWLAAPADEALRRAFAAVDFDDRAWERIAVPGHWRTTSAFAASDGPLLYRHAFPAARPADGERCWLVLEGVFYDGDVWLDGSYVGATEGYFFPHAFEVTEALGARDEHVLGVEVGCTPAGDRNAKRSLTGVFGDWDCLDPAWNPGGIWRPVRIERSGPVRVASLRVLCPEASPERAQLDVRTVLNTTHSTGVILDVTVSRNREVVEQRLTRHTLAVGDNRIRMSVPVNEPELWWPHALGPQPLYDVEVRVLVGEDTGRRKRGQEETITAEEASGHIPSDDARVRTGLRQIRMSHWVMTVNGERLFVKGSNQGPSEMALGDAAPGVFERDVLLARDTGLDLLRVHAHISRPELYDAADRHGMLLWQDLPLQRGYARSVRKQAIRQATEAVDLLGHHPSIVLWCGHNEPAGWEGRLPQFAARQELPSWNKTVLDRSVRRSLERADPTRPVIAHSGVWPNPVSASTDSHLYFGWYVGHERDLPRFAATVPSMTRFVSEFGAQAVPTDAAWMQPDRWPNLDWDGLAAHHGLQRDAFDTYVPPFEFASFDAWRDASQAYQAEVIRFHVETLRRLKYRPSGGFCQFCFADGHPGVTWSVLDHARQPKAGLAALSTACAPVIVVATRPEPSYAVGDEVVLDVHVISDLRAPLADTRILATLGPDRWGWSGTVAPDSCVYVGTVRSVLTKPGRFPVRLTLRAGDVDASNRYDVVVTHRPTS